ncbi:MAG: S46 family peptidase [Bacteroidales bacterium]|nr:S46 family peptidase [Bacteroidales bacterium]MBN2756861.1 S46 family peptidase [Bacteroidales bacterium]
MKKILSLILVAIFAFNINVKADEGMWFLAFINKNYSQMKAMGFKLSPKDIYDINHSSMKDAVVALDYGSCTAELVSPYGLLLTNHHCGYDEIQQHSSVEHDYLTDGFWAKTRAEELPNPGKTVTFLVRMEDVSDQINALLRDDMTEDEREMTIKKVSEKIKADAIGDTHYEAQVRSFFNGNNFYLFVLETYKDVRLVGAPPSSIGKFGSDTDNWMWPRHTGDFSMFRVYTGPDGKPAEYSADNVPLKPKYFFPVSIKGVKENDFAMVMGYPGSTDRYSTSWGVEQTINNENDIRIKVRGAKQEIIKKYMDKSDKTRIQYSSKYYQSTNYYKYSIGQNQALDKLKVTKDKKAIEKELTKWIESDKENREAKYGETLDLIKKAYTDLETFDKVENYLNESVFGGAEIFMSGYRLSRLYALLEQGEQATIDEYSKKLKESAQDFFKNYDSNIDKEVFVALMEMYKKDVPKEYYPTFFETVDKDFGGDMKKYADKLYSSSIIVDKQKAEAFLANPKKEALDNDMGYQISMSFVQIYRDLYGKTKPFHDNLSKGTRKFVAAWIEMQNEKNPDKLYYPDANSTIRLTYGKVGGYKVGNKIFDYTTDLKGVMDKEDPKNEEFIVSPKLKELYNKKDYGKYADNGRMVVCFTTNNDITGGNSGSPVLNGNGELIGIAFDGNWEAMSGDIAFDPELQKCINVDIRYVLFIIDKYAGATNLVDEMTVVRE